MKNNTLLGDISKAMHVMSDEERSHFNYLVQRLLRCYTHKNQRAAIFMQEDDARLVLLYEFVCELIPSTDRETCLRIANAFFASNVDDPLFKPKRLNTTVSSIPIVCVAINDEHFFNAQLKCFLGRDNEAIKSAVAEIGVV
jgi:hypothetical protein